MDCLRCASCAEQQGCSNCLAQHARSRFQLCPHALTLFEPAQPRLSACAGDATGRHAWRNSGLRIFAGHRRPSEVLGRTGLQQPHICGARAPAPAQHGLRLRPVRSSWHNGVGPWRMLHLQGHRACLLLAGGCAWISPGKVMLLRSLALQRPALLTIALDALICDCA